MLNYRVDLISELSSHSQHLSDYNYCRHCSINDHQLEAIELVKLLNARTLMRFLQETTLTHVNICLNKFLFFTFSIYFFTSVTFGHAPFICFLRQTLLIKIGSTYRFNKDSFRSLSRFTIHRKSRHTGEGYPNGTNLKIKYLITPRHDLIFKCDETLCGN